MRALGRSENLRGQIEIQIFLKEKILLLFLQKWVVSPRYLRPPPTFPFRRPCYGLRREDFFLLHYMTEEKKSRLTYFNTIFPVLIKELLNKDISFCFRYFFKKSQFKFQILPFNWSAGKPFKLIFFFKQSVCSVLEYSSEKNINKLLNGRLVDQSKGRKRNLNWCF